MVSVSNYFANAIVRLTKVLEEAEKEADLSKESAVKTNISEFNLAFISLNAFIQRVRELIRQIQTQAGVVDQTSKEMIGVTENMASTADETQGQVEGVKRIMDSANEGGFRSCHGHGEHQHSGDRGGDEACPRGPHDL